MSIQTSYSSGTLLDQGCLASQSSQHVRRHYSSVSYHKKSHHGVLLEQVLKGLESLHLSLLLLRDGVLHRQGLSS